MDNTSEVVLRNEAQLGEGPLLLINPPRDALLSHLLAAGRAVRASSQDFGDFRWLEAGGAEVSFDIAPQLGPEIRHAILKLPREKERLSMILHAVASQMTGDARLWLVGENRAGIKSAPRQLENYFGRVEKLDSARHCGLFEAREPRAAAVFRLEDYLTTWSAVFAEREISLFSLPGVFAHGRLDRGTAMLLEVLENIRPAGKILDFACGSGVLGLSLLTSGATADMTLLDASSMALECARQSLAASGLHATLLPSDGLAEVTRRYDWIISNPPFHRGVDNDLDIAATFFRQAGTFLAEKGNILIVFNRHLPYSYWLHDQYENVECLATGKEYAIVRASGPGIHR